ncbi:protein of unknown function (plasmid) [Azospirillum baldaniorum]|uniref:Uncharacterized protein n=1 Tax=Azospirillum baldaniorum TaxID=1064539 RepID=A0A9P1JW97_9PROT|nr:protein of unknown function [Azospirillum baldaniorum]
MSPYNGLANRRLQPLGHPSYRVGALWRRWRGCVLTIRMGPVNAYSPKIWNKAERNGICIKFYILFRKLEIAYHQNAIATFGQGDAMSLSRRCAETLNRSGRDQAELPGDHRPRRPS